jgi:hypothetical protein
MDVRLIDPAWIESDRQWRLFLDTHRKRCGGDSSGMPEIVDGDQVTYEPWRSAFRRRQVAPMDAKAGSLRLVERGVPRFHDHLPRLLFHVSEAFLQRKIEESRGTPKPPDEPVEQVFAPWLARPPHDPLRRIAERIMARHACPSETEAQEKPATGPPTTVCPSPARNSRDPNPASPTPV